VDKNGWMYRLVTRMSRLQKRGVFLLLDLALIGIALALAFGLHVGTMPDSHVAGETLGLAMGMIVAGAGISVALGMPRIKLNAYEMWAIMRTAVFAVLLAVWGVIIDMGLGATVPGAIFVLFAMLFLILSVATRLGMKHVLLAIYRRGMERQRVLIYGAGKTGVQLVAALRTDDDIMPVAFADDNPTLQQMTVAGLPVYPPRMIREMVEAEIVDRVVLAMPSIPRQRQAEIARELQKLGCEVQALPSFAEIIGRRGLRGTNAPMPASELLGRAGLEGQLPAARETYAGRSVLVSGAGGTIGSELCRQLLSCKPTCLVLFEISEIALYTIEKELLTLAEDLDIEIVPVLGSVNDGAQLRATMAEHGVDIVLHAAAYKHVPMVERNEVAGLRNNVLGTKTIAEAAREMGVRRFILVSSDKAVRPTSIMGASKRFAELIVQDLATRSDTTRFAMVRFGNVLGSSGSVLPLFQDQIAKGGPVTLTHNKVTRFFMTVTEAARLVLLAGGFARGGDVFVLDMGRPVPIRRLARQMIEGAGYRVKDAENPDGDIEIVVTGLRPGEKLHEELLIGSDMLTTPHPKILRAQETFLSEIEVANAMRDLRLAVEAGDAEAARAAVVRWVEGYAPDKATQKVV
jgi:FlaA1/EpsC-like NDP-sugar epimerase